MNPALNEFEDCIKTYKKVLNNSVEQTEILLKEIGKIKTCFKMINDLVGKTKADVCLICFQNERNKVLVPCGHLFCEEYTNKMVDKCFVCKRRIQKIIKIFK